MPNPRLPVLEFLAQFVIDLCKKVIPAFLGMTGNHLVGV
jgi:hypothetical protein